jgi:hypothetical protein
VFEVCVCVCESVCVKVREVKTKISKQKER